MSEQNKAIARRFLEETWNNGNLAVIDELIAADHVNHSPGPQLPRGPEGSKMFIGVYKGGFPDTHVHIEDQIAEGDKVFTRWSAHGANSGEFMGMPATGKAVHVSGMIVDRIANGQIVESWSEFDQLGMLQQLGVAPMPN
jgi:steroid delta-isomerase-like uncharacterized protein